MNPILPYFQRQSYYFISIENFINLFNDWRDNLSLLKKYLTKLLPKIYEPYQKLALVCAIRIISKNKHSIPFLIEHKEALINKYSGELYDLLFQLEINDHPLISVDDIIHFLIPITNQKHYTIISMEVCLSFFFYQSIERVKSFLNYDNHKIILIILTECERHDYDCGILDKVKATILNEPSNIKNSQYISILLSWLSDTEKNNQDIKNKILEISKDVIPIFIQNSKNISIKQELYFYADSIRSLLLIFSHHHSISFKYSIYENILSDKNIHIEIRMMILSIFCVPYYVSPHRHETIKEFLQCESLLFFQRLCNNYILSIEYPISDLFTIDQILFILDHTPLNMPYSVLSKWPKDNKSIIFRYLIKKIKESLHRGENNFCLFEESIRILYSFAINKKEINLISNLFKKWIYRNSNHPNFTNNAYRLSCCLLMLGITNKKLLKYLQDDWRKTSIIWPIKNISWENITSDLINAEVINNINPLKIEEIKKHSKNSYYINNWHFFKSILMESDNFYGIYRIRELSKIHIFYFSEILDLLFNIKIDYGISYSNIEYLKTISLDKITDQNFKPNDTDYYWYFSFNKDIYSFDWLYYDHDCSEILSLAEYVNIFLNHIKHHKRLYVFDHYDPLWEEDYDAFYELYFFSAIPSKFDPIIEKANLPIKMPSIQMRNDLNSRQVKKQ